MPAIQILNTVQSKIKGSRIKYLMTKILNFGYTITPILSFQSNRSKASYNRSSMKLYYLDLFDIPPPKKENRTY